MRLALCFSYSASTTYRAWTSPCGVGGTPRHGGSLSLVNSRPLSALGRLKRPFSKCRRCTPTVLFARRPSGVSRCRSDGSELPYLLLRLNDWVRQVRQAAIETVERKIAVGYARHFTKALFLVVRLERTRRGDHLPILSRIYDLLASPAARDPMLAELRSGAGYARRASFRILTRPPSDDIAGVLLAAAKANDSVIRLWAARSLATALEPNQLRAVLSEMFRDPSAPVRREALAPTSCRESSGFSVPPAPEAHRRKCNASPARAHRPARSPIG